MNGATAEIVASSCSEALAGLSRSNSFKVPPDFCADAGEMPVAATANAAIPPRSGQKRRHRVYLPTAIVCPFNAINVPPCRGRRHHNVPLRGVKLTFGRRSHGEVEP